MKIIAITHNSYYAHSRKFLVEMNVDEICRICGVNFSEMDKVNVGYEGQPVELFKLLQNVRDNQDLAEKASNNLKSLASLVDTVLAESRKTISQSVVGNEKN